MVYLNQIGTGEPPIYKLTDFRGMNNLVANTQIMDNESPEMRNIMLDERKQLKKRYGYDPVFPTALGPGKINGLFEFQKIEAEPIFLIAYGTKLYKLVAKGLAPTVIYTGLYDGPVTMFLMNDKCYILDGVNYFVYDGTTVSPVVPYIPTIMISSDPASGTGTEYEDINLLSDKFIQTFSGVANQKKYQLTLKNLDATPPIAIVNNVQTTAFIYDPVAGTVEFTNAPSAGTNNVSITASKTGISNKSLIVRCKYVKRYGGTNDSRIFLSGNPVYGHYMWRSGLYDPTYFPENGFYAIGSQDNPITGFEMQYNYLVVFKQRSIYSVEYHLDEVTGTPTFPIKLINNNVGAWAPKSIALIENNPVFFDRSGVYELVQSNVKDERNVRPLSERIDNSLLFETNMKDAIAIDYDNKYYLSLNGNVYVYDYPIQEWYVYDNIVTDVFLEYERRLYWGSEGQVWVYKDHFNDKDPYNDNGLPIKAFWRSKVMSFNSDEELKYIKKVFIGITPSTKSSVELWYTTDKKNRRFFKKHSYQTAGYILWNYAEFNYGQTLFPKETVNKVKVKKCLYFQLELRNEGLNESLDIQSIGIQYLYQRLVK